MDMGYAVEQLLCVVFVPVGGLWTVTNILKRLDYENAPRYRLLYGLFLQSSSANNVGSLWFWILSRGRIACGEQYGKIPE